MIRLMIADDHQMFIDGIRSLVEGVESVKVVGSANDGLEALRFIKENEVDVVLMDINMPVLDGIDATKRIREEHPEVRVLMLTMYNDKDFIMKMVDCGASGYILKNTGKDELITAIRKVQEGGTYYSDGVMNTIMDSLKNGGKEKEEAAILTPREKDVLKLIVAEHTTNEIAEALFISQHTVETHRKNMLSKLNLRNTAGLVRYAMENQLA